VNEVDERPGAIARAAYLAVGIALSVALFWDHEARLGWMPTSRRYVLGIATVPIAYLSVYAIVEPRRVWVSQVLAGSPLLRFAEIAATGAVALVVFNMVR
jgi:hypothetical protein